MSDMVKVRIAVAINDQGDYSARGDNEWDDKEATEEALDNINEGGVRIVHFIEVNMPIPKPQTFVLNSDPSKYIDHQRG